MALYSIAFSLAHIFSHNSGMQMIAKFGFETTWNIISIIALIGVLILFFLMKVLRREKESTNIIAQNSSPQRQI